jgi:hypothetical protein
MGFGLVNRFIDHLQVITTNNYSANANSHSAVHYSMYEVFSVCCIFTGCRLVTASIAHCLTLHNWTLNCTALTCWTEHGRSSHIALEWTHGEHRLHHLFYCCVTSPCMHMLRALHSNGRTRQVSRHLLYCCVQALPSNGWCWQSHLLATGQYTTLLLIYVSVAYLTMLSYIRLHSLK